MGLQGFYKENIKREKSKPYKVAVSDAFQDENGKAIEWELKPLRQTTIMDISNKHLEVIVNTDDRTSTTKGSVARYNLELMAKTIVYPNLRDQKLQDSYGVVGEEDLLNAMFEDDNEGFNKLLSDVNKVNSGKSIDELVKEVKN